MMEKDNFLKKKLFSSNTKDHPATTYMVGHMIGKNYSSIVALYIKISTVCFKDHKKGDKELFKVCNIRLKINK